MSACVCMCVRMCQFAYNNASVRGYCVKKKTHTKVEQLQIKLMTEIQMNKFDTNY